MTNVMAALPNIGGALCSTPQSLVDATTRVPCSNAAKTRNPLKLPGVHQTNETLRVFKLRRYSPTKLCDDAQMAIFGDFFASCISESRTQHVSDLHSKFALRPHIS